MPSATFKLAPVTQRSSASSSVQWDDRSTSPTLQGLILLEHPPTLQMCGPDRRVAGASVGAPGPVVVLAVVHTEKV